LLVELGQRRKSQKEKLDPTNGRFGGMNGIFCRCTAIFLAIATLQNCEQICKHKMDCAWFAP
jgi:hypothetical protein